VDEAVTSAFRDLQIVKAIRRMTAPDPDALYKLRFTGNEWSYLKERLDSTFVSSVGKFVDRFESDLAAYSGARHAVAAVNGTAALHAALKLAGVCPGDEVLLLALTFVATANTVAYCAAIPHFLGGAEDTLCVDPQRAGQCVNRATGRVIRAGGVICMTRWATTTACPTSTRPSVARSWSSGWRSSRPSAASMTDTSWRWPACRRSGFVEPRGCTSKYWLQTLLLDEAVADQRDAILAATNDASLMTRPAWTLMHSLPAYQACPRMDMPAAKSLERHPVNLQSSAGLSLEQTR
jgi:dTDP-4-amino-4,6-dideoxygalactose transaminase